MNPIVKAHRSPLLLLPGLFSLNLSSSASSASLCFFIPPSSPLFFFPPSDTLRWIDAVTETLVACQLLNKQLAKGSLSQETSQWGEVICVSLSVHEDPACKWSQGYDLIHVWRLIIHAFKLLLWITWICKIVLSCILSSTLKIIFILAACVYNQMSLAVKEEAS